MSEHTIENHLQNAVRQLQNAPQYQQLLGLVSQVCSMNTETRDPLAIVADTILRDIARDLSNQSRTGRIILHINVVL